MGALHRSAKPGQTDAARAAKIQSQDDFE